MGDLLELKSMPAVNKDEHKVETGSADSDDQRYVAPILLWLAEGVIMRIVFPISLIIYLIYRFAR